MSSRKSKSKAPRKAGADGATLTDSRQGAADAVAAVEVPGAIPAEGGINVIAALARQPSVSRSLLIWLAAVAFCVAWQPFELGFYMDDWGAAAAAARQGAPFSRARFEWILNIDPSRPVSAILRFVCSSLLADRPVLWQAALLVANLSLMLLLARLIRTAGLESPTATRPVAVAVASAWLLMPWSAGFRFWPVLLNVHLLLLAFAWMVGYVTERWRTRRAPLLVPGVLYLLLCLGYEALYLQFVPLILLGLCFVIAGRARMRDVLRTGAGLVTAQGLAVAWYMVSKHLTGAQKPISPAWQEVLTRNLQRIIPEMLRSLHEVAVVFVVCASAAALLCVYPWLRSLISREQKTGAGYVLLATASCLAGGLLSIAAFSFGERPLLGLGVETRAFTLFSFWLVLAVGIQANYARARLGRFGSVALTVAGLGLGLALSAAHLVRLNDWATAWRLQQKFLAEAPVERIAATEKRALILTVLPIDVNGAPVFAAPWDLSHALPLTHPRVRGREFMIYSKWGGPLTWDGKQLSYAGGQPRTVEVLYIWKPEWREFYRAVQPLQVNQDLTVVPR